MNQKYVFLWALFVTLFVFNLGIFMGYMLESSRVDKINDLYAQADLNLLDQRIQSDAFDVIGLNCDKALSENIKFADRVYEDALKIQKYEDANKINSEIVYSHKKYDLLRTLFWINSIKIKEKCNLNYHNVVYIYKYNDPNLEQGAKQQFFSNLLMEVKQKYIDKIMLIPIAGDNDLPSVNLLMDKYNITVGELPVILIDEKIKINNVEKMEDIEKYLA
ncbi:MAG: hypothetical protein Q7R52_00645 [archaeon]|nr:hypothetical protein [archaeon]